MRILFDLSELFFAPNRKSQHYGIMHTVIEVAYEISKAREDVKFVVYNSGTRSFHEVNPILDQLSDNKLIDHGLHKFAKPLKIRTKHYDKSPIKKLLRNLVNTSFSNINKLKFKFAGKNNIGEININNSILISLARPKLIIEYINNLPNFMQNFILLPYIYDLIPLHDDNEHLNDKYRRDISYIINNTELVMTCSNYTKREIIYFSEIGKIPFPKNISVIQLAQQIRIDHLNKIDYMEPLSNYIMTVGCKPGYKNIEVVLHAAVNLKVAGKAVPNIVIAGKDDKKIKKYIARTEFDNIRKYIYIISNPTNEELCCLYKNAFVFVFPSLIEGWGLPLGEALSLGVVSIASDIPVLREVGGDLPIYFDPKSGVELAGIIDYLQSDSEAYSIVRDRVKAKQGQFRVWADVAHEIMAIADGIAEEKKIR